MDNLIAACSLSAFAGVCFAAFYSMIAAKAPASWLSVCLIILAAFTILSAWLGVIPLNGARQTRTAILFDKTSQ